MTLSHNVISRTHFRKRPTGSQSWQWYWHTESIDARSVAHSGRGYGRLDTAIRKFMAHDTEEGWVPTEGMFAMPENFVLQKFASDHYVITKYVGAQKHRSR